jgi:putative GTP pyrophosphokinase
MSNKMNKEMDSDEIASIAPTPVQNAMRQEYDRYLDIRHRIVADLKERVERLLVTLNSSPVVSGRIKNFTSYFYKYLRFLKNGMKDPKITDLLGVRIICPFIEDLSVVENLVNGAFNVIETESKGHYTFKEFGYESTHLLITIPQEIIDKHGYPGTDIAEIQIRTILQDAWAEVEHEIVYKAEFSPFDEPMRRKLAAVNASLSLADIIFQEIRSYQRKYSREIEKRRESFYNKIEESIDDMLFAEEHIKKDALVFNTGIDLADTDNISIDDLLVSALSAHNENRFNEAINQYGKILKLNPGEEIKSVIFKHRGMAHFACSQYNEAIDDFDNALKLDSTSYKAAYYRGVVRSVLKQYSQAIDDYSLALSINPYQSFCLFRRGQAYYHIGDLPQALSDCENSLALDPTNKSADKFKDLLLEKLRM